MERGKNPGRKSRFIEHFDLTDDEEGTEPLLPDTLLGPSALANTATEEEHPQTDEEDITSTAQQQPQPCSSSHEPSSAGSVFSLVAKAAGRFKNGHRHSKHNILESESPDRDERENRNKLRKMDKRGYQDLNGNGATNFAGPAASRAAADEIQVGEPCNVTMAQASSYIALPAASAMLDEATLAEGIARVACSRSSIPPTEWAKAFQVFPKVERTRANFEYEWRRRGAWPEDKTLSIPEMIALMSDADKNVLAGIVMEGIDLTCGLEEGGRAGAGGAGGAGRSWTRAGGSESRGREGEWGSEARPANKAENSRRRRA